MALRSKSNLAELGLRALMFLIGIIVMGISASQVAHGDRSAKVIVLLALSILALILHIATTLWNFWAFVTFMICMAMDAILVVVWLVAFVINVVSFGGLDTQTRAATVFAGMNMFLSFFAVIADWFVGRRKLDTSSYV